MATIHIKYCDIPSYLHDGDFYRNLDSDDPEGVIEIPADCFHPDGERAADLEEFRQLLKVMMFCMLDDIPTGVLEFCNEHEVDAWKEGMIDLSPVVSKEIQPLLLMAYSQMEIRSGPLHDIVKSGRWNLIRHAVRRVAKNGDATAVAARCGHLRLLQYLHEEGFAWHEDTCSHASWNGHSQCLQYAHENGCPWDVQVCIVAATNGHLSCMKYAFEQGLEWEAAVCEEAALSGHLDCLQFAREHGCPWDSQTTQCAAQEGHEHCLRYALDRGCPVDEDASTLACMRGQLACLQLLHEFGVPWSERAPYHAAQCPDVACLQFLHENGCPWDEDTVTQAVKEGHIGPLRYALEQGCPFHGEFIVETAAHSTSLECLQYLIVEQDLYIGPVVFLTALLRGDLACLQYLLDQGCHYPESKLFSDASMWKYRENAFRKDNPEFVLCVQFAVERGWPLCGNFINYIVVRDEACKDWLIKEGYYVEETDYFVRSRKRIYDEIL